MVTIRILIVGDEAVNLSQEMQFSRIQSFWTVNSYSVSDSLRLITEGSFDSILVSETIDGKAASEVVRAMRTRNSSSPIFLLGKEELAPESVRRIEGLNYIPRSIDKKLLVRLIELNARCHRLELDNDHLQRKVKKSRNEALSTINLKPQHNKIKSKMPPELVGSSVTMQKIRKKISEVAPTDMSVMIVGETGTGKDVVARSLHHVGNKPGQFVKISCPALPEQLLESELFGHEAGAFTGATQQKPGRMELAMNGSVFLDEIAEIPSYIQAKLLEVLESKSFTRVGSTTRIEVNLSIIAATNVPLNELLDGKKFRRDLYYRLNQYYIEIPPLRDHMEDVPELAQHFMKKYGRVFERQDLAISEGFTIRLMQHDWPGNIRELESVIRHFALTQDEHVIVYEGDRESLEKRQSSATVGNFQVIERQLIYDALNRTKWNRREAAKILGMSYNTLRRRIAKYELI